MTFSKKEIIKKRILIVDDNALNLKILKENINDIGMISYEANNGKSALEIAEKEIPDLILLDIMMPSISGFDVCKILKSNPKTKDIPIIFLTAKTEAEDIVKGFELGAVDYINKPFLHPAELLARINTHLKLQEYSNDLLTQNDQLNQLIKDKNDFLSIAAHDLKNPIYSISILAKSILEDENISKEDVDSQIGEIISTSSRMLEIINSILDINALEEGKKSIKPEEILLEEMVQVMIRLYEERAKIKGIKLHYSNSISELVLFTDRMAINQSLDNLISNAIKYSPFNKNIYIRVSQTIGNNVKIEIQDEGPGISANDLSKMFGKFVKLTARPTGDESSTGLGLSIVKRYIESIGGTIHCESQLGHGANFIINIPASIA